MPIRRHFTEQTVMFLSVLKWFFLATVVGSVVGLAMAGFFKLLNYSIANANIHPYFFLSLPLALVLNGFLHRTVFKDTGIHSTDNAIAHVHENKPIPFLAILEAAVVPLISIPLGGSTGKEAPAADIGAGIGSLIGRTFRLDDTVKRKLTICGISAGFASVFGTPIAGAIFGVEMLFVGSILYDVMFPAFIAGITSYQISSSLGVSYFYGPVRLVPVFSEAFFLKVALGGVFFGFCSFVVVECFSVAKQRAAEWKLKPYLKELLAGAALVGLALVFSTRYLGLGLQTVEAIIQGQPARWYDAPLKMVFTVLTVNFSGGSGLLTPIFFMGTALGSLFGGWLHLDAGTFASIGFVSLLAGTTNTPIASSILAIELFGPAIAPYAAVACVISFLMTGYRSIYPSQILKIQKSASLRAKTGTEMDDIQFELDIQQKTLSGSLAEAVGRLRRFLKKPPPGAGPSSGPP